MKRQSPRGRQQHGGVLVATMIACLVLGLVVVSYLTLISSATRDAHRSETWNGAMALAEAGVEEALAHLQRNYPSNLVSQGWNLDGASIVRKREMGTGFYVVRTFLDPNPTVTSRGSLRFAGEDSFISRAVQIQTVYTGLVHNAFATKLDAKLNGNNVSADSYDSTDPALSSATGGYDPAKARDRGYIATNLGTDGAFDAGNANIRGRISTGPDGTVALGPNAVVGSDAWHKAGSLGAEPGAIADDSNVIMPPVEMPDMSGAVAPRSGDVNGTNYNYVLASGTYQISRLAGTTIVTGDATLLVTDNVNISGLGFIFLQPGAKLKMYVAAKTATIGGLGVVNDSSQPGSFIYYGLPSNQSMAVGGNGQFSGVIYAPDTDLSLGGNGHVYGAIISKTLSLGGETQFHFDESLSKLTDLFWFKVAGWQEI